MGVQYRTQEDRQKRGDYLAAIRSYIADGRYDFSQNISIAGKTLGHTWYLDRNFRLLHVY